MPQPFRVGTPPAPVPPVAPRPQAPPPGLTLARWLYVDERRTHELHAGIRGAEFVVRESAYGNEDADEIFESVTPIAEAWEGQLFLMELENRLGLLGKYWRFDVLAPQAGWTLVHAKEAFESLDMRTVRSELYEGRVAFYHFHKRGSRDVVLVNIPSATPRGPRYMLAQMTFDFPNAADGDLDLLHPRLPTGPAQSLVARAYLDAKAKGYDKLIGPQDFALVHGKDWRQELHHAYETTLQRLSEGRLGSGKELRARDAPVDDLYTDYLASLSDPRLIALHARFLQTGEEQQLMEGGETAIRRFITKKREEATPNDQHLLTILQASLLARDGLRAGQPTKVDPEVAALVRRFAFYL